MSDQMKAIIICTLESATTFIRTIESDFRHNKPCHLDKISEINKHFTNTINLPEIINIQDGDLRSRIRFLHQSILSLSSAVAEKVNGHILFSNRAVEEISCLFPDTGEFLRASVDFLTTDNSILLSWLENKQNEYRQYCDSCATSHEERLIEGICVPAASLIFLDMLRSFNGIYWQALNVIKLLASLHTPEKEACSMNTANQSKLLTIYIGEALQWKGKSLYHAIILTLKKAGIAGATVVHGIEGYGPANRLHTSRLLDLSADLPVVIMAVDKPEKIEKVLPLIRPMVPQRLSLITISDVWVVP